MFWLGDAQASNNNKEFREGVLSNGSATIPVTIWSQPMFHSLTEEVWYDMHDMNIKRFNQLLLATTIYTLINKCNDENLPEVSGPDLMLYQPTDTKAITPEIVSCTVVTGNLLCSVQSCQIPFEPEPNQLFTKCPGGHRQLVSKMKSVKQGKIDIEVDGSQHILTFHVSVFEKYFETNMKSVEEFEEKILLLENVMMTYNTSTSKILSVGK